MVSLAAFGPANPGSNPSWFAAQIQNEKLSVMNNTNYDRVDNRL